MVLKSSFLSSWTVVVVIALGGRGSVDGGSSLFKRGCEVFHQRFGFTPRDEFFGGEDESNRKGLHSKKWEQLQVDVKLEVRHILVELGGLLHDVLVDSHENGVRVHRLVDRLRFVGSESPLIVLPALYHEVD